VTARHAGLLLPLFSAVSTSSWGIGELPSVVPLSEWLSAGGFDRLMLLPLGTMPTGESSPYSAMSAMAIDPIYIAIDALEDFSRAGGLSKLSENAMAHLQAARDNTRVHYEGVRGAKFEALAVAFDRFMRDEWEALTPRAGALAAYIARERWWLDDYALYQAIAGTRPDSWRKWPEALRDRDARGLDDVRRQLGQEVLRHQYWQWIAETQWQDARAAARAHGVEIFGDMPFVVGVDSADVWARPNEFLLEVSAGVPPDAFSADGQDWGLPTYRWGAIAQGDYAWLRQRARRMAALFDGFRIDHLVGFYRTYGRPPAGEPFFSPADEASQLHQGERILEILRESGAAVLAEDLGTVPDFVRASLARLGVPGSKVLRWERAWHVEGQPFLDPASLAPASVAMTGTHDTETLASWWEAASLEERAALLHLPFFREREHTNPAHGWTDAFRDALLELAYGAGSNDLFVPMQDLFGWRDRINIPAIVGDFNWTWRLPWPVDRLLHVPEAVERARVCRSLARQARRGLTPSGSPVSV
jgi:4-alpha-glucanotransferase